MQKDTTMHNKHGNIWCIICIMRSSSKTLSALVRTNERQSQSSTYYEEFPWCSSAVFLVSDPTLECNDWQRFLEVTDCVCTPQTMLKSPTRVNMYLQCTNCECQRILRSIPRHPTVQASIQTGPVGIRLSNTQVVCSLQR